MHAKNNRRPSGSVGCLDDLFLPGRGYVVSVSLFGGYGMITYDIPIVVLLGVAIAGGIVGFLMGYYTVKWQ